MPDYIYCPGQERTLFRHGKKKYVHQSLIFKIVSFHKNLTAYVIRNLRAVVSGIVCTTCVNSVQNTLPLNEE